MNYLERNALILDEIGTSLTLERQGKEVCGKVNRFTPLGGYKSQVLGRELFVGLREPYYNLRHQRPHDYEVEVRDRVVRELAFIQVVAETFPDLIPQLPAFYGLLNNSLGKSLGIIMEDFSQRGRYKLKELCETERSVYLWLIPSKLGRVIGKEYFDSYETASMCFMVGSDIKFGDFDSICGYMNTEERQQRFPEKAIACEIGRFTLRTADSNL